MNFSAEDYQLWEALLKAHDNQRALSEVRFEVTRLHSVMEGPHAQIEHPISEGLRALIGRARELSDAFRAYEQEIEGLYQDSAWRFVRTAYGIHKGDRIEFTDWHGKTVIGAAEDLHLGNGEIGELTLHVLLLKKDGSPGKREDYIYMPHKKWRNLGHEAQTKNM